MYLRTILFIFLEWKDRLQKQYLKKLRRLELNNTLAFNKNLLYFSSI